MPWQMASSCAMLTGRPSSCVCMSHVSLNLSAWSAA
jgi:hypothetical protein